MYLFLITRACCHISSSPLLSTICFVFLCFSSVSYFSLFHLSSISCHLFQLFVLSISLLGHLKPILQQLLTAAEIKNRGDQYFQLKRCKRCKRWQWHWWCESGVDDNAPLSSLVVPSKTDEDAKRYYQLDKSWKIRGLMDVVPKKGEINDTAVLTLMCAKSRSESVKRGKSARYR